MVQKIILASQSPRRRELMSKIGIEYTVEPPTVEENITKTSPWDAVMELSEKKAFDVFRKHAEENVLVIGADTMVAYGNCCLGKPQSEEEAINILKRLQSRVHQVYTGLSFVWTGERRAHTLCEKTEVELYPMTEEEILSYVKSGEGMDKAGAYGIQTQFSIYIKQIRGEYNNVVGLPIARLYHELQRLNLLSDEQVSDE